MRKILISVAVAIVVVGGSILLYAKREKPLPFTVIPVERRDLIEQVSVAGSVKPVRIAELRFERSGTVKNVHVNVGATVQAGDPLVTLESSELEAQLQESAANLSATRYQLAQQQAVLEKAQIGLREVEKGTRAEELDLLQARVENGEIAVKNARQNLAVTEEKAAADLAKLQEVIPRLLHEATVKADEALHRYTDRFFENGSSADPRLILVPARDAKSAIPLRNSRKEAIATLDELLIHSEGATTSSRLQNEEGLQKAHILLLQIQTHLDLLSNVLDQTAAQPQDVSAKDRADVGAARDLLHSALASIIDQEQAIRLQKTINQNNLLVAETRIDEGLANLDNADKELILKEAGATAETLAIKQAEIAQTEAALAASLAQVRRAEASVRLIKTQLNKTILHAPFNGMVIRQEAEVGETVTGNVGTLSEGSAQGTGLVSLMSDEGLKIEAFVPEVDIRKVRIGQQADATLDAYGTEVLFPIEVGAIDPAETVLNDIPTYKVSFHFKSPDARIRSGMTVNIDLISASRKQVLAVPQRAIFTHDGKKWVKVLLKEPTDAKEPFEERSIQTGLRGSDGFVEVVEGLKEGEEVIL